MDKGSGHIGDELRAERLSRGLSQQRLAESAGVTQAHLSQIERGLDARYSVLSRVASALDRRVALKPVLAQSERHPYEDESANRQYLLGLLAARRLTSDRLLQFRNWIERSRKRHGDYPYFREWLAILDRGPSAVAATLVDATEHGRYMRSVATLLPFVTRAERDAFYRERLPAMAHSL